MKNLLILISILISNCSFGQEWFFEEFIFEFSDIKNEQDLNNFNLYYVNLPSTRLESIIFNKENSQVKIIYATMGNHPILIIEKENKKMYVLLLDDDKNTNAIIQTNFSEGAFKPKKSKLNKWEVPNEHIEWLNPKKQLISEIKIEN